MEVKKADSGSWSPYLAGGLSGLVIIVSVLWTGKFFGASTSFVRSAGMLGKVFDPERERRSRSRREVAAETAKITTLSRRT